MRERLPRTNNFKALNFHERDTHPPPRSRQPSHPHRSINARPITHSAAKSSSLSPSPSLSPHEMRRTAPPISSSTSPPQPTAGTSGGVIRPRTIGLKRHEEPPPPPPPPPPSFFESHVKRYYDQMNPRVRLMMAVFLSVMLLTIVMRTMGGGGSSLKSTTATIATGNEKLLMDDDDEDGEGAEREDSEKSLAAAEGGGEEEALVEDEEGDKASSAAIREMADKISSSASSADGTGGNTNSNNNNNMPEAQAPDASARVASLFANFGASPVEIDKEGSYKYVLVKVTDKFGESALLVRGCPKKEGSHCKHADVFHRTKLDLEAKGYKATVLGGGRITRHPSRHTSIKAGYISIFGYSKTFGACANCNKLACVLVKASLPDHGVKWSTEGYLESDEKKIKSEAWTKC